MLPLSREKNNTTERVCLARCFSPKSLLPRWSNEFAHGSLNDMAWLEVVWHFHNMNGICLGVLPGKKCGKRRGKRWNQPRDIRHYHWQLFQNVFDFFWMLSNNLKRQSMHLWYLVPVQPIANPVGPLDLGLDVLAWVFALRIFHCKIFMNLYESFENSLWRTRWRVFFMWIRQMNFNWCCANLYRLVFDIVKHQSWQLELAAEWRTNSLLLGFLMQP